MQSALSCQQSSKIAEGSPDRGMRDIKDIIEKGMLRIGQQGGRSTNYEMIEYYQHIFSGKTSFSIFELPVWMGIE
jgi:hypothetical protein